MRLLPLATAFLLVLVAVASCCLAPGHAGAQASVDIFAVRTWMPPPPPPPPVDLNPAPPVPQAPALPFRFLGKIVEPGKKVAFLLALSNRVVSVAVGEIVDGLYLVEKYQDEQLYFIYRPMKIRQSIPVGRAS